MRIVRGILLLLLGLALAPAMARADAKFEPLMQRGGDYTNSTLPVRITVVNNHPRRCRCTLEIAGYYSEHREAQDTYQYAAELAPGEQRQVALPLLLSYSRNRVRARLVDENGEVVGATDTIEIPPMQQNLILALCGTSDTCQTAQSRLTYYGSAEERALRNSQVRFVPLPRPADHWWEYRGAVYVLVAQPLASLTEAQKAALEGYARQGGTLALLADEVGDKDFLAAYRSREAGKGTTIGRGNVVQYASVADPAFPTLVRLEGYGILRSISAQHGAVPLDMAQKRLSPPYELPSLWWLLTWVGIYIVVVGPLNFAVLRKMKRLELGWITMPAISVLFALAIYVTGAAKAPKTVTLKEIKIYWMDEHSGEAAVQGNVRVAAPRATPLRLALPGDAVLTAVPPVTQAAELVGDLFGNGNSWGNATQVRLGERTETDFALVRWSYADTSFLDFRQMAGPVHLVGSLRLRNDTGRDFRDAAVVLDGKVYEIGALKAGVEVDLAQGKPVSEITVQREKLRRAQPDAYDASDVLLLQGVGSFTSAFAGILQEEKPDASASIVRYEPSALGLVVVELNGK